MDSNYNYEILNRVSPAACVLMSELYKEKGAILSFRFYLWESQNGDSNELRCWDESIGIPASKIAEHVRFKGWKSPFQYFVANTQ